MDLNPSLMMGKVMHKRLFPRENGFTYRTYYLALPVSALDGLPIALNRFAPLSFHTRDHGPKDGGALAPWAQGILKTYGYSGEDLNITLVCMPRIFGYVFNPVSFWLARDASGALRAVICEVNNTFGETHCYLCRAPGFAPLTPRDILTGEKLFHVSPFLEREGHYTFRFNLEGEGFGVWIDFYDAAGRKKLITALMGKCVPMTRHSLRAVFWSHPLITFKTITLIHWQAIKLLAKGIKHIKKPKQKPQTLSAADNLTQI